MSVFLWDSVCQVQGPSPFQEFPLISLLLLKNICWPWELFFKSLSQEGSSLVCVLISLVMSLLCHLFSPHPLLPCEHLAVNPSLGFHSFNSIPVNRCCKALSSGNMATSVKTQSDRFCCGPLYLALEANISPFFNRVFSLLYAPIVCHLLGSGGVNATIKT